MKNHLTIAAGLITGITLIMAAAPAMAHQVDVGMNISVPAIYPAPVYSPAPVYVQPQPVYVQPRPVHFEREREWREHELRARYWAERRWQERRYWQERRWHEHHDWQGRQWHERRDN
jgi:hypothetical protein